MKLRLPAALVLACATWTLYTTQAQQPNLRVTGIRIVDANDKALSPVAGQPFFVEIDWTYSNPVCTPYTLMRVVNGWTNTAPSITWGCGFTGNTSWAHNWGDWVVYKAGTYPITVIVDSGNAIAESNENDNILTTNLVVGGSIVPEWALVNVEFGRTNLGSGTDVIVGTMDDAFDYLHPWYAGNDSLGRPRLLAAAQNSLGTGGSPTNSNHSTGVMGIVLARGANNGDITGFAPDARYVTAEFINRAGVPNLTMPDILDAANFLMTNGVEVINMSWSWWLGSDTDSETGEAPVSDLMADYLSYASNIVCVPAVNELTGPTIPTAPGAARNVITVGGLEQDLIHAWRYDNFGPTLDGRSKPDVLGNCATNCVAPSSDWRAGFPCGRGYDGNSFSAPFVTGAVAQMIDYAKHHNRNRDHRLIKAILMNSGIPALGDDGSPWSNSTTVPLDRQQGTGIFDLKRVYAMYSAPQQPFGPASVPGFDFTTVYGTNTPGINVLGSTNGVVSYRLGSPAAASADLDVTLAWDRHTFWLDANGNGRLDAADSFYVSPTDAQDNLDLVLYRDGLVVAQSRSTVDTIEHLHLTDLVPGAYELKVERLAVLNSGDSEPYGLAWHSTGLWTNLPPVLGNLEASLAPGNTATIQFQLASGQAGNFELQLSTDLSSHSSWSAQPNAALTQTGPTAFQFQLPLDAASSHFFRIKAIP